MVTSGSLLHGYMVRSWSMLHSYMVMSGSMLHGHMVLSGSVLHNMGKHEMSYTTHQAFFVTVFLATIETFAKCTSAFALGSCLPP